MSFQVTIRDAAPPPRKDGFPYTHAKIQESSAMAGPWALIDTLTLAPEDANPADPILRELSTSKATLASGFYRVVWVDAALSESTPSDPIPNPPEGPRPSISEVAALLRARTKIKGGGELGTFSAQTRPTADEVEDLITEAVDEVLGKVKTVESVAGMSDTAEGERYERRVRGAVRLYTAMLIENSYFPEQIGTGQSAAPTYEKLYQSRIKSLIAEGETGEAQGEGSGGAGGDSPGDPFWSFPENLGGQISLTTRT